MQYIRNGMNDGDEKDMIEPSLQYITTCTLSMQHYK